MNEKIEKNEVHKLTPGKNRYLFATLIAVIFPILARLNFHGTGVEYNYYRFIVPTLVGGGAGFMIGLMKDRWLRLQHNLETLVDVKTKALKKEIKKSRQAEQALRKSQETLELRVANRTAELFKKTQELGHEISERQVVEVKLRESKERLETIINSVKAGIIIIDPENHEIVNANPAALDVIGVSGDLVLGRKCQQFICSKKEGECPITDKGLNISNTECDLINIQGEEVPILKTVVKIYQNGKPFLLESFIDISRLKDTQMTLEVAKNQAESANRAKSDFLANMSHEFRTPLNHIIGFTEIVVDQSFGELNATQEEYLNDALGSSRRLLSMVNDILDLARVEAGNDELAISKFNLQLLLENSLDSVDKMAKKKELILEKHIGTIPETIRADERRLKQIISNLLSNAIKFSQKGGIITLKVDIITELEQKAGVANVGRKNDVTSQTDHSDTDSRMIKISISDTGIGVAREHLNTIFDPFEQADNTKSKRYQGTGLGLSLAALFVEMHGGRIWVDSEGVGKGAVFSFTIPDRSNSK